MISRVYISYDPDDEDLGEAGEDFLNEQGFDRRS